MKQLLSSIILILTLTSKATAQDMAKGLSAFESGNYDQALVELRPLADSGNVRAQSVIGLINFTSVFPRDYAEALRWNRLAASQGNQSSQFLLGLTFKDGFGVEQNYQASHVWFNIAAMYGDVQAASERDNVGELLSTNQLSRAMALALICVETDYESCPY